MKKRFVIFMLCAALLTGTAAAAAWPDWAEPVEAWAQRVGLDAAWLETPSMTITRGQAAQLLYEAAGSPAVSAEAPFTDVPDAYADAVTWAAENGFVQGTGDGRYLPDQPVTRQEFAAILYRGAGSPHVPEDALADFTDAGQVSGWARDAMGWCVETGLMNGKSADQLVPRDTIIAAEAILMLQRANAGRDPVETVSVSSLEDIQGQLRQAMAAAQQPPAMDISRLEDTDELDMAVRNLYYAILAEQPELKYAYDLQIKHTDGGLLQCSFSYMPYHTGNFPAGFDGTEVNSLWNLMEIAMNNIGAGEIPIRITNRDLTVDDMNKALQQAGGGYILCQLNRDATAIVFTALDNMSGTDGFARLKEIDALADTVVTQYTSSDMTDMEKARALYTYLTETVKYDFRYYSDRASMSYDSQTAYGALHDQLAICGGYAQALQILFEKAGIPCCTVSGDMGGESHMWNIAYLDGAWRYFDATSDRGRADYWFNCFNVTGDQLTRYTWDTDFICKLTGASF